MNTLYAVLDHPVTKWLFVVFALVMPLASLLTWAERRQSAMMQDRLGPNRAAPTFAPWLKLKGILHFVADAIKMCDELAHLMSGQEHTRAWAETFAKLVAWVKAQLPEDHYTKGFSVNLLGN